MDFVMSLPLSTSKKNAICVIVDRLTKSAHFLPIKDTWRVEKLAQLYVKEIVRLHEIPLDIVLDRDQRFQTFSDSLVAFINLRQLGKLKEWIKF